MLLDLTFYAVVLAVLASIGIVTAAMWALVRAFCNWVDAHGQAAEMQFDVREAVTREQAEAGSR